MGGRWPTASGGGAATCVQPGMEMAEPAAPVGWSKVLNLKSEESQERLLVV